MTGLSTRTLYEALLTAERDGNGYARLLWMTLRNEAKIAWRLRWMSGMAKRARQYRKFQKALNQKDRE